MKTFKEFLSEREYQPDYSDNRIRPADPGHVTHYSTNYLTPAQKEAQKQVRETVELLLNTYDYIAQFGGNEPNAQIMNRWNHITSKDFKDQIIQELERLAKDNKTAAAVLDIIGPGGAYATR
jgi:hypothetical protein